MESCAQDSLVLDCGIATARIVSWLEDELDLTATAERSYEFHMDGGTCHVGVRGLPNRTAGRLALERTELTIDGDAATTAAFMRLFTLRFISAGG